PATDSYPLPLHDALPIYHPRLPPLHQEGHPMSDLLNELLAVPTAPRAARKRETEFTSKFEISDGSATAELRGAVGTVDESAAYEDRKSTRLNSSHVKISY